MRGAHDAHGELVREIDVAGELAAPGDKRWIFKPRDRLPIFQAKKIEMIDREAPARIFVQNRKRRACDGGAASQSSNETFHELSLATSEFAFESQNRSSIDIFRESLPDCLRFSRVVGNERSHGAIFDP